MKTILIFASLVILSSGLNSAMAMDANAMPEPANDKPLLSENRNDRLSQEEINQLELRILEIRDMDKSALTDEEKLELREELRDIAKAARQPYVYISIGGGTILLIILLILLLR